MTGCGTCTRPPLCPECRRTRKAVVDERIAKHLDFRIRVNAAEPEER